MHYIKEQTETHAVIRTDTYARSIDHVLRLFEELKKDFPEINPREVNVVEYAGSNYAGTLGLEFRKPKLVSENYRRIPQLEKTK